MLLKASYFVVRSRTALYHEQFNTLQELDNKNIRNFHNPPTILKQGLVAPGLRTRDSPPRAAAAAPTKRGGASAAARSDQERGRKSSRNLRARRRPLSELVRDGDFRFRGQCVWTEQGYGAAR
ncbi:NADH dehydrogenase [Platysternon megacephalum]|uniref:NADH dehydrogenase n=1 Tax=Platysternon megacephalum TaxID=55544 RepID=A0A4D9F660_9SAUR|nr:NADH dehydrogenase [Platysternon megacephalum]